MYALFIDDDPVYRAPPEDGREWVRAFTSAEAIAVLDERGWPEHISFDHDLGGEDTSMVFLKQVIERLLDEGVEPPFTWAIHSANPIGRRNIEGLLDNFTKCMKGC